MEIELKPSPVLLLAVETDNQPPRRRALPRIYVATEEIAVKDEERVRHSTVERLYLDRIERVDVHTQSPGGHEREQDGVKVRLSVYLLHSQRGLPKQNPMPSAQVPPFPMNGPRPPDYTRELPRLDLKVLHSRLWRISLRRHPRGLPCGYCNSVFNVLAKWEPHMYEMIRKSKLRHKPKREEAAGDGSYDEAMSQFLNELLDAVRRRDRRCAIVLPIAPGERSNEIPVLVHAMLAKPGAPWRRSIA